MKLKTSAESILICLLFFVACRQSEARKSAEYYLGNEIPETASEFHFKKINFSPDYNKPYNIYVRFLLGNSDFLGFIQKLKLVSYNNHRDLMCLSKVDSSFDSSLWTFKSRNTFNVSQDASDRIDWWKPNECKDFSLFASFYNESLLDKFVHCYKMPWDGRILLGYDKKRKEVYIIIEVLM